MNDQERYSRQPGEYVNISDPRGFDGVRFFGADGSSTYYDRNQIEMMNRERARLRKLFNLDESGKPVGERK